MSLDVQQFGDPHAFHGEGPVWNHLIARLQLVDMLAGDILTLGTDGALKARTHVGSVAAAIRPRTRGGLVVALERGFALLDEDDELDVLPTLWTDETIRMNEGGCDPDGAFYCGSMSYDWVPHAGALYRLSPSGEVSVVLDAVGCSNGLDWSPDGNTVYYVDSFTHRIDAFDVDHGRLLGRRTFVDLADVEALPDGLTIDSEGGVWIAFFGGSQVRRYDPRGALDAVIELPVSRVTACTFGGDNLDTLFITTSRDGLQAGTEPQAGAVFVALPGVRGRPARPFAG